MSHERCHARIQGFMAPYESNKVNCPCAAIRGRLKGRKVKEGNVKGISLYLPMHPTVKKNDAVSCNEAGYL